MDGTQLSGQNPQGWQLHQVPDVDFFLELWTQYPEASMHHTTKGWGKFLASLRVGISLCCIGGSLGELICFLLTLRDTDSWCQLRAAMQNRQHLCQSLLELKSQSCFRMLHTSGQIITTSLRPHYNHSYNKGNHPNMALIQVGEIL